MTFDLSDDEKSSQERARAFAVSFREHAAAIDRTANISGDLRRDASAFAVNDPVSLVIALAEIAAESAAVALAAVATSDVALGLSGLRGAMTLDDSPRTQLALAATALGVGRKALDLSLEELRRSMKPAATGVATSAESGVEKPHWVVADVATELDAAKLMLAKAARTTADADIALARLLASSAAERAVAAALRLAGPAALAEGATLERLARDVRALTLVCGTEERQRAVAAEGVLPR